MTTLVFDAGALTLMYADGERLRSEVEKIQSGAAEGLVSAVTLAEFYYKTCQTLGKDVAALRSQEVAQRMQVAYAGEEISKAAGLEKCRNNRLSLADSFVLALARARKGVILTTDSELAKAEGPATRHFRD